MLAGRIQTEELGALLKRPDKHRGVKAPDKGRLNEGKQNPERKLVPLRLLTGLSFQALSAGSLYLLLGGSGKLVGLYLQGLAQLAVSEYL